METHPDAVLEFWFGDAALDPAAAEARERMWFESSRETDAMIGQCFIPTIETAARGGLAAWAHAPRSALALVVVLDQFPRNAWRGTARAFACDAQALRAAQQAVAAGHLERLAPVEQAFATGCWDVSPPTRSERSSIRVARPSARQRVEDDVRVSYSARRAPERVRTLRSRLLR